MKPKITNASIAKASIAKASIAAVLFSLVLISIPAQDAAGMDGAAIIEMSRNRIQADTTSVRYRMIITARGGSTTELQMDQYSKNDAQGNSRSVAVFGDPSPASVRGTRFLTLENSNRSNDQWIFLPSLGRVRRIAATEGSGSFVGTDFSYDDIASADRRVDLDTHRLLREETLQGRACYVIESIPLETSYQYSRMIQWVDRENFVTHRVELYDRRGSHVKTLEILELREVQGRLSPTITRMTTIAAGTSTTLNVLNLRYDDNIPESVFTTNFLETGRP